VSSRLVSNLVPSRNQVIFVPVCSWLNDPGSKTAKWEPGKTTKSLAVVEYLRTVMQRRNSSKSAYPALVVGPGVVTGNDNWPKEIREVIPGAKAKVIDAAVRPVPKPAKVKDWAKSMGILPGR